MEASGIIVHPPDHSFLANQLLISLSLHNEGSEGLLLPVRPKELVSIIITTIIFLMMKEFSPALKLIKKRELSKYLIIENQINSDNTLKRLFLSKGFEMKPEHPHSIAFSLSSAYAVCAIMGTSAFFSRISFTAVYPSITGIFISIKIRSILPAERHFSTASFPLYACSTSALDPDRKYLISLKLLSISSANSMTFLTGKTNVSTVFCSEAGTRAETCFSYGIVKQNVVPFPGSDVSQIFPPRCST